MNGQTSHTDEPRALTELTLYVMPPGATGEEADKAVRYYSGFMQNVGYSILPDEKDPNKREIRIVTWV